MEQCSVTCGIGMQNRFRLCIGGAPGEPGCSGLDKDVVSCDGGACPSWGLWGSWSTCSATCNGGFQVSVRWYLCSVVRHRYVTNKIDFRSVPDRASTAKLATWDASAKNRQFAIVTNINAVRTPSSLSEGCQIHYHSGPLIQFRVEPRNVVSL